MITFAAAHNMAMLPTEGCVAFGPGPEGESRPVHVVLEAEGKLQHQLHQATLRKGRFMKGKGVVYQVRAGRHLELAACTWLHMAAHGWPGRARGSWKLAACSSSCGGRC